MTTKRNGLSIPRFFTRDGVHPYDEVNWVSRDVVQTDWRTGATIFEQRDVEFPDFWSTQSVQICVTKYFRGHEDKGTRETSLKDVLDRIAKTYAKAGLEEGYFKSEDAAQVFEDELTWLLLHQRFAFNSPVWFNVGAKENPQVAACYILSVDDSLESILNWYREEGLAFKGGSGCGTNLSKLREEGAQLAGSGTSSGPVSFMRGADASAGTIKSGGATRRAAKLVCLDVDHPDVEKFIDIKAREERKIRALRDAGFDMDLGGEDMTSVQYQNANNSVRVDDAFMNAVMSNGTWNLTSRIDGEVVKTVDARELFRKIATAAWECADPGIQMSSTITKWHTTPVTGPITASNPCFTGDTQVVLADGRIYISFAELAEAGTPVDIITVDERGQSHVRKMTSIRKTRENAELVRVVTASGGSVRCTPDHQFMLADGTYLEASKLAGKTLFGKTHDGAAVVVERVEPLAEREDVYDGTVRSHHNFAIALTDGSEIQVHNCSEYMSVDNSSCNLASLNLMKFLAEDGKTFDVESFVAAIKVIITAMDISICFGSAPTEAILNNTKNMRQLGIGFSNLGALLMATGHGYDSEAGRHIAAAITSLMTSASHAQSMEIAKSVGGYAEFAKNKDAHHHVIDMHIAAGEDLDDELSLSDGAVALETSKKAIELWSKVSEGRNKSSYRGMRNAQLSVMAPTGTISFLMDCDTTGMEPDFSLVKFKKLVGGGSMQIVNQTVPMALRNLGYTEEQVSEVVEFIAEHGHVVGAPHVNHEHYEVFDCAVGERSISPMGHILMMAAIQPFLSGAQSKTVNLPESYSVEDIEDLYIKSWKMGLKAVAVYRDNCKVGQPLSTKKIAAADQATVVAAEDVISREHHDEVVAELEAQIAAYDAKLNSPLRKRLPRQRSAVITSFDVAGSDGYLTMGMYDHPDGIPGGDRPGEMFLKMGKQGSTMAGVMDAFAIAVSVALQHGVPLESLLEKFINMKFEPAGITQDPDIRFASSIIDYVARRIALDHLSFDERAALGVYTAEERIRYQDTGSYLPKEVTEQELEMADEEFMEVAEAAAAPVDEVELIQLIEEAPKASGPMCTVCGGIMQRAGSCFACSQCGQTSGCS